MDNMLNKIDGAVYIYKDQVEDYLNLEIFIHDVLVQKMKS